MGSHDWRKQFLIHEEGPSLRHVMPDGFAVDVESRSRHHFEVAVHPRFTVDGGLAGVRVVVSDAGESGPGLVSAEQWRRAKDRCEPERYAFLELFYAAARRLPLKHGPRGTGAAGPCDKDCLKCVCELWFNPKPWEGS